MIAVIETGGKQYLVHEGQTLKVEKIEAEGQMTFPTLLIAEEDGSSVTMGKPEVAGAMVTAKIVEQGRDEKIEIIKFKSKVRYRRHNGHRQPFTRILIEKISAK
ncbi:MAG: 50S ribosomal protein L21 [Patescibacteria group bacterium]